MPSSRALIDLSHTIEHGLITYKGLPAPLDSPFHRFANGKDLSELDLSKLANLPAIKISALGTQAIDVSCFPAVEEMKGKAVLVETGWSRHWNTPQHYEGHPFLTHAAAELLADAGVLLVGIDSHNIDDTRDMRRPAHTVLLGNEIPIVEHMTNLTALPAFGFRFFCGSTEG